MTKLIYIGGFGRSGSTMLEVLMAANPEVVACGEVGLFSRRRLNKKWKCSCGQSPNECPVWRSYVPPSREPGSSWTHQQLTLELLDHFSKEFTLMVDSSKTAWGSFSTPFKFRRKLAEDFLLVHVVRNPRGVCWSNIRKKKRQKHSVFSRSFLRCGKSSIGWWMANLSCELFARAYPKQYMRIRYEDLTRSPHEVLQTLFTNLLPDQSGPLDETTAKHNRHQLYGNRMRLKTLLLSDVREDVRWENDMPLPHRRLVAFLTWPLRYKYGY